MRGERPGSEHPTVGRRADRALAVVVNRASQARKQANLSNWFSHRKDNAYTGYGTTCGPWDGGLGNVPSHAQHMLRELDTERKRLASSN